jgi:hypothetical protein
MELKDWVGPIIACIVAVISLRVDAKSKGRRAWLILLMAAVATCAATIVINTVDAHQKTKEQNAEQTSREKVEQRLKNVLAAQDDVKVQTARILAMLETFGLAPAVAQTVDRVLQANAERARLLPKVKEQAGLKATIVYFPKDVDGPKVISALQQGGFGYQRGISKNDEPTNMIWVSRDISIDDAKFVALTLSRAGIDVKAIRRLVDSRPNLIQIGSYTDLRNSKPLTIQQLSTMCRIPADSEESYHEPTPYECGK